MGSLAGLALAVAGVMAWRSPGRPGRVAGTAYGPAPAVGRGGRHGRERAGRWALEGQGKRRERARASQ